MSDRKRINAHERDAIMRLFVAEGLLNDATPDERLRGIQYGLRDYRAAQSALSRTVERLLDTVPLEQLKQLQRNLKAAGYTIGVKRPGALTHDDKNFGLWIPWRDISELLSAAREKCLTCTLDKQQRRSCPLAKVLDNSVPNDAPDTDDDCRYFGVL